MLNEAITAYGAGKLADANRLYREAALVAKPDDLRVLTFSQIPHRVCRWATASRLVVFGANSSLELAQQVAKRPGCVKVVGHTSRTGTVASNDSLSQRRVTSIMQNLGRQNKQLGTRVSAEGVGSRENLIGLGTDDNRDALDRRVEFRVVDCS